jgi:hypothetical protein
MENFGTAGKFITLNSILETKLRNNSTPAEKQFFILYLSFDLKIGQIRDTEVFTNYVNYYP